MLITSQVKSYDTGETLPGANIVQVGTNNGAIADADGRFTINVPSPDSQLRISFLGFDYDTFRAGDINYKTAVLYESAEELETVNVPGYVKPKKDNTIWWVLGIAVATLVGVKAMSANKQPKPKLIKV